MEHQAASLTYTGGAIGEERLRQEIAAFFEALEDGDEAILEDADANGVDLDLLRAAGPDAIRVEQHGAGFGAGAELILLFFLEKGLELGWQKVIKPYIDRRNGGAAIGELSD